MGTARGGDRAEDGPGSVVASLTVPIALESPTSAFFVKENTCPDRLSRLYLGFLLLTAKFISY